MQPHTKAYMDYMGLGEQDVPLCELCGQVAVDVHHVYGRTACDANEIHNLIGLCRKCHTDVHSGRIKQVVLFNKIADRRIVK